MLSDLLLSVQLVHHIRNCLKEPMVFCDFIPSKRPPADTVSLQEHDYLVMLSTISSFH